jgi:PAS domain-containing protein
MNDTPRPHSPSPSDEGKTIALDSASSRQARELAALHAVSLAVANARLYEALRHQLVELRASETRFRNIVKASPMGIHLYELQEDDRLIFIGANAAAETILGQDYGPYIGKTIEEAFPGLVGTEVPARYREAARLGAVWGTEQIDYSEGAIKGAFEVVAFQTEPGKMAVWFNEITARKRAEQEREKLQAQLAQAQKMGNNVFISQGINQHIEKGGCNVLA